MIRSIRLSRYRCFRREQEVNLGRFNLFYGGNGSGKSALLRLLPLIDHSIAPGLPPGPNASSSVLRGAAVEDLWCKLKDQPSAPVDSPDMAIEVEGEMGAWRRLRWVFDIGAELRIEEVTQELRSGQVLHLRREATPRHQEGSLLFRDGGGQVREYEAAGLSLWPAGDQTVAPMLSFPLSVLWLTAHHAAQTRSGARPRVIPWTEDGAAAETLALAMPRLREAVSLWFERHLQLRVVVADLADRFRRIEVQSIRESVVKAGGVQVPLADSADGVNQVFPLLVALELAAERGGVLVLEEPEAHLHPQLQRALAEHIVEVMTRNPTLQVMVETHSELFLLAALKAAIEPLGESVRLHWVDVEEDGGAFVRNIALDAMGRPTSTELQEAFSVIHKERRALLDKRARHYAG